MTIQPNRHVSLLVATAMIAAANDDDVNMGIDDEKSRTELDSHANMVVVGRHASIVSDTGRTAEVSPFTPDYEALQKVPIVDAAILYLCPYSDKSYLLIVRNALSVPSMKHNLIPPFILREAGVHVHSTPKIHAKEPTIEDHSIYFPSDDFRIPLSLWGVFSYFPTSRPDNKILEECEEVFLLTPDGQWDPHSDAYARNEESMLDWEGNMVEKKDRMQILLSEVEIDAMTISSAQISKLETKFIDERMEELEGRRNKELDPVSDDDQMIRPGWSHVPREADEVSSVLCSVSSILDPDTLCSLLCERGNIGRFQSSIGSTNVSKTNYLQEDTVVETVSETDSDTEEDDEDPSDDFIRTMDGPLLAEVDFDEFMASAAHAKPRRNTTAEHLSKVWRIDLETAKKTLDITSQNCNRVDNSDLSRNYSTNDKMLRYRRIKDHFFMDTFFATSKAGKSSRGNTCCQLFVTDKGFVYVVPMKTKS